MKINIEEHNINKFKKWCKKEEMDINDEQDLEDALNKFIENNLDLIF